MRNTTAPRHRGAVEVGADQMRTDEWSVPSQQRERSRTCWWPLVTGLVFCVGPMAVVLLLLATMPSCDVDLSGLDGLGGPGSCETSSVPFVQHGWFARDADLEAAMAGGTSPDASDTDGRTALYCAARAGNESTVRVLLDGGADPNIANAAGDTPLLWAAHGGHVTIADLLLARGADPNLATDEGHTPLFRAVSGRHPEVASILLQGGADPAAPVSVSEGDVIAAIMPGDSTDPTLAVAMISGNCPSVTQQGPPPGAAARELATRLCQALNGHPGAAHDVIPLHAAALKGDTQSVAVLLDHAAPIDATSAGGFTPLHAAALGGDPATVHLLLERGADPTPATTAPPPHELARWLGHTEAADILGLAALAHP